jgi:hypothetical protein
MSKADYIRMKTREEFRKWMKATYGTQDAQDYSGTFTEDIALKFSDQQYENNEGR